MNHSFVAHLDNGSAITPDVIPYRDIPRQNLVAFDIVLGDTLVVRVDLRPDKKATKNLIYRKRNQLNNRGEMLEWLIVGWQRTTGEYSLCYVMADGSILLGGEPEDGKDFQEPVQLFEWEF